jgi:hypothetical protein
MGFLQATSASIIVLRPWDIMRSRMHMRRRILVCTYLGPHEKPYAYEEEDTCMSYEEEDTCVYVPWTS